MKISMADVQEIIANDPHALLVDVRSHEEYDAGHIPGAGCMPLQEITDCLFDEALCERGLDAIANARGMEMADDASVILLYCRSGSRSSMALQHMEAIGYVNAYNVGGVIDWPYDLVTTADDKTAVTVGILEDECECGCGCEHGHDNEHTHNHNHGECGCGCA